MTSEAAAPPLCLGVDAGGPTVRAQFSGERVPREWPRETHYMGVAHACERGERGAQLEELRLYHMARGATWLDQGRGTYLAVSPSRALGGLRRVCGTWAIALVSVADLIPLDDAPRLAHAVFGLRVAYGDEPRVLGLYWYGGEGEGGYVELKDAAGYGRAADVLADLEETYDVLVCPEDGARKAELVRKGAGRAGGGGRLVPLIDLPDLLAAEWGGANLDYPRGAADMLGAEDSGTREDGWWSDYVPGAAKGGEAYLWALAGHAIRARARTAKRCGIDLSSALCPRSMEEYWGGVMGESLNPLPPVALVGDRVGVALGMAEGASGLPSSCVAINFTGGAGRVWIYTTTECARALSGLPRPEGGRYVVHDPATYARSAQFLADLAGAGADQMAVVVYGHVLVFGPPLRLGGHGVRAAGEATTALLSSRGFWAQGGRGACYGAGTLGRYLASCPGSVALARQYVQRGGVDEPAKRAANASEAAVRVSVNRATLGTYGAFCTERVAAFVRDVGLGVPLDLWITKEEEYTGVPPKDGEAEISDYFVGEGPGPRGARGA
jgi:hypothetical protein